jgi:hypothetical protein
VVNTQESSRKPKSKGLVSDAEQSLSYARRLLIRAYSTALGYDTQTIDWAIRSLEQIEDELHTMRLDRIRRGVVNV